MDGFDVQKIARYNQKRIKSLLANPGIIRNRLKVESTIQNAKAFLKLQDEFKSFSNYQWSFVNNVPIQNKIKTLKDIKTQTKISDALSKDLLVFLFFPILIQAEDPQLPDPNAPLTCEQNAGILKDQEKKIADIISQYKRSLDNLQEARKNMDDVTKLLRDAKLGLIPQPMFDRMQAGRKVPLTKGEALTIFIKTLEYSLTDGVEQVEKYKKFVAEEKAPLKPYLQ